MKIAQVAPLYEAVPPQLYGGTERVVAHLADALVQFDHDVKLFASAEAQTAAKLMPVRDQAIRLRPVEAQAIRAQGRGRIFTPGGIVETQPATRHSRPRSLGEEQRGPGMPVPALP